jgi:hypothetical protein
VVSEEGLEILDIELTVEEGFFSDEIKALECLCRQARRHLQENLGINARLTLFWFPSSARLRIQLLLRGLILLV